MALTSERRGRVAVLTLSRPDRLNAIGTQTLDLLASGTQRLPRLLPAGVAAQMILTGEPISSERAHCLGLVNELAAPGQALAAALCLAGQLAAGAPLALAAGKRLLRQDPGLDLGAAIARERETVTALFGTADRAEGLAAFRERRPGNFTGR
jgi:enoyl-CoA hydratase